LLHFERRYEFWECAPVSATALYVAIYVLRGRLDQRLLASAKKLSQRKVRSVAAGYSCHMEQIDRLRTLGLFDSRVPRYTSYPTAPIFSRDIGAPFQEDCLRALDPEEPVSVYLHVPFCERLCWFCACQTQGTKTLSPVESYVETMEAELALMAQMLPEAVRMGHLHWGGGTPTILPPHMIARVAAAIRSVFPAAEPFEFSVETDPTMIDTTKVVALQAAGMTRASIGIQDFAPEVQEAIGRIQSFETTRDCIAALRAAGVTSLNTDLVYGLPHQTLERLARTVEQVLTLSPDRIALFGYAHVPHMSKRQRLIDESALPSDEQRFLLAQMAQEMFTAAGYVPIGIDHFARPGDSMAEAAVGGRLRRNFQGYTADACPTLIGLGASSISRFPNGYVQNAAATAAYAQRIGSGSLAGTRGHVFTADDRLRGRAIEQLMCDFRIDQKALESEIGPEAARLRPVHAAVKAAFGDFVDLSLDGIFVHPEGRAVIRMIAARYDGYDVSGHRYSKAS
jgi:oxygen-independent coproporphyrinogen-3 oxidase